MKGELRAPAKNCSFLRGKDLDHPGKEVLIIYDMDTGDHVLVMTQIEVYTLIDQLCAHAATMP